MICKDGFQILLVVQFQEVIVEIEILLLYYVDIFPNHGETGGSEIRRPKLG